MGRDKARLVVEGEPLGARLGRLLAGVASPVLEVGPGVSGLEAVVEEPRAGGPLVAVVAGWRALRARGHTGPVLVLACDLPFVEAPLLELLADRPGTASVMPRSGGRRQPLCARWGPADLAAAAAAVAAGERAIRGVGFADDLEELPEACWTAVAGERALSDVDSPEDLARFGLPLEVASPGSDRGAS